MDTRYFSFVVESWTGQSEIRGPGKSGPSAPISTDGLAKATVWAADFYYPLV